jgi:protein transport protein SEC24
MRRQLQGTIGGKIITLTATLPTLGEGALKARDDPKLLGTSKVSLRDLNIYRFDD